MGTVKHHAKAGALLTGDEYEDDEHILDLADADIPATIARDSEVTSAVGAEATARDAAIEVHRADTTNVHGVADTANLSAVGHSHAGEDITSGTVADARVAAALARDSEVTSAISTHAGAVDPHADRAYADSAIGTHSADTTAVHGIADTANVVLTNDARLSDARTPSAHKTSHQDGGSDEIDVTGLTGLPTRTSLGLATSDSPEFAALNVGAAVDTTITRTGAGEIAVEGNRIFRVGGADVPVADGGTGASTAGAALTALGAEASANKNVASGYAPLDSGILVPIANLPVGTGASQVAAGNHTHAGSSDVVQNKAGNGNIVIPGLAADPDINVAGGNDDEFDTTDTSDPMTGWTTLGTPTAHDINSTLKSHYFISKAAASGTGLTGIYKAWTPSAGHVWSCKLTGFGGLDAENFAGIAMFDGPSGRADMVGIKFSGSRQSLVGAYSFTTPTGSQSTLIAPASSAPITPTPLYCRFIYTSSTSVQLYASHDGLIYNLLHSYNPGFTPDSVGLLVQSANASFGVSAAFDWIRRT